MKLLRAYPPNFSDIVRTFPGARGQGVMFTYGGTLYVPGGTHLVTPALLAHEQAHSVRQLGLHPADWWNIYLVDKIFRLEEELVGHRAEYQHLLKQFTGKFLDQHVRHVCERLSGPLYGRMMSYGEAEYVVTSA